MKKKLILSVLALLGMTQAVAQEYEYVPFVREGVKWVYYITHYYCEDDANPAQGNGHKYMKLEFKGDTVINGKTYKAMHDYSGDEIDWAHDNIIAFFREEDKVVYGILPDNSYSMHAVGNGTTGKSEIGEEFVMYDFREPSGFLENSALIPNDSDYYLPSELVPYKYTDTITVGDHKAQRGIYWKFDFEDVPLYAIEGIGLDGGFTGYPLFAFYAVSAGFHPRYILLDHIIENGEIIYKAQQYEGDQYLPLVREGVTWVNERVMVNQGDTTSYYYSYQFDGNDPLKNNWNEVFKALYCYEGQSAEGELVAGMRETDGCINCYRNDAWSSVVEQGRNMLDLTSQTSSGDITLYYFYHYSFINNASYYTSEQREGSLNGEWSMIDPVFIENKECDRCAFIGENGDTLAYVVEGIGFDSYDMGDLLTPFTRKPDPNADYQEYCGLSHVVKDGKIIYKGMRYRHGAFTGIDEVEVADRTPRPVDPHYYNLMGQPVGTEVPTAPGIYIHNGNKIIVR